ncbi:MAG: M28 family metallopeptidase [Planctomycetota bacterium]
MARAAAKQVSEDSYRYFLDDMLYTHLGDDRGFGPEHDLAQANIAMLFADFGLTVTLEPVEFEEATDYNVVGTRLGTTYPDQEYIIGAHYDSAENPGADDNASGVALALEAARVLSAYPAEYTIRFIAFDREESGLLGAYAYVEAHIDDDILAMINLDMIAYSGYDPEKVKIYRGSFPDALVDALTQSVADCGFGMSVAVIQAALSDDIPFFYAGFTACGLHEIDTNPHFHLATDSVDTEDYIDYTYATRITRGVVGFLVDHAGVIVPVPIGDFDGDDDVDVDDFGQFVSCFTGPGGGPVETACDPGDLDFDDDIDCADWEVFVRNWTEEGDPPILAGCPFRPVAAPSPHDTRKNRYISLDPHNTQEVAFEVELTDGPGIPHVVGWVADPFDPSCEDEFGTPNGDPCEGVDYVSRVVSGPVFRPWNEGVIHVGDCEIVPVASYAVRATMDGVVFTSPLELATINKPGTRYYGDTVGMGTGDLPPLPGFTGPNGAVNVTDVQAFLLTVQGPLSPSTHTTWVDMHGLEEGSPPNFILNVSDLQRILFGIEGLTYTATPGQLEPMYCP